MAGIILKDRSGNSAVYEDIIRISVPYQEVDGAIFERVFTRLQNLKAYLVKANTDGTYLIKKKLGQLSGGSGGLMVNFTNADCVEAGRLEADGTYSAYAVITTKTLEIGTTYQNSELWE